MLPFFKIKLFKVGKIMMQITEKYLPFGSWQTYCRIVGEATDRAPLLLLHGGLERLCDARLAGGVHLVAVALEHRHRFVRLSVSESESQESVHISSFVG